MKLENWGWCSIGVNVLLIAAHAAIAARSGSLAVAAELTHNAGDLLTAIAVLVGLKLAVRRTRSFPYGLHKVENLVAAGLAVTIFITAYNIAGDALFAPPASVHAEAWMLASLVATAALPLVFSHFELRAGRRANSPALIADAQEYRIHVFTTGLALVAVLSAWVQYPVDRYAALIIVLAVVKTAWDLLRDAMRVLLDASLDAATLLRIREVVEADPAVTGVQWVMGRNAGRFRFVEAGVTLRAGGMAIEGIVHRIEDSVRACVPHVERVLVHVEAPSSPCIRYAVPLADAAGLVSEHFGKAPFFAFIRVRRDDGNIKEQRILANPHCAEPRARGIRVAEWLVSRKVDVVLVHARERERGFGYVLANAGVELRTTDAQVLNEALPAHHRCQR